MDYPCAKFGVLVSAVLVLSCGQRQNHRQTESLRRMIAILTQLPSYITTISVSNYILLSLPCL